MEHPGVRPEDERSVEIDGSETFASRADELGIPNDLDANTRSYLADLIDRRELFKKLGI